MLILQVEVGGGLGEKSEEEREESSQHQLGLRFGGRSSES